MKSQILFLIWFCFSTICISQNIELQTLSSMGTMENNAEISVGESIIGGNSELTQGFHQGKLLITQITDWKGKAEILVFPNPTAKVLMILNQEEWTADGFLYGANGNELLTTEVQQGLNHLDIQYFPPGNYILILIQNDELYGSFHIQKTH